MKPHPAFFLALVTAVACAPAQPPVGNASPVAKRAKVEEPVVAMAKKSANPRLDAIWASATERLERQQDIWFNDGDFPVTIQSLKVQANLQPADYEVWTNLGWMQENIELYEAALATYITYRLQNPNEPDRALPEAVYYNRKRMYVKIPPLVEPALTTRSHPNNYRLLARAYEQQGLLKDSQRIWKRYLSIAPNDGAAKNNLARVERKLAGS